MLREGQETWHITHIEVTYGRRLLMLDLKHGTLTYQLLSKLLTSTVTKILPAVVTQNKLNMKPLLYMHFL